MDKKGENRQKLTKPNEFQQKTTTKKDIDSTFINV